MKLDFERTRIISVIGLIGVLLFFGCDSENEFEINNKVSVKIDLTGELTQYVPSCLVIDENNPSNRYIRIDSALVFGFGFSYIIPDSLKDSDLKIIASGKMRESDNFKGSVAITLSNTKDSTLFWDALKSENHLKELNKWVPFKDSTIIYKQTNNSSAKTLKAFTFKNQGKGTFDVDDLIIEIVRE